MIDKDDFEDFLMMNGGFDNNEPEKLSKNNSDTSSPHSLLYYIGCALWVIFVLKCC
jgi:hypothetical protein